MGLLCVWVSMCSSADQKIVTARRSIPLNKGFLVTENSLLGPLRAVYAHRCHVYSDGLRTTQYTAFCFV